jgi:hypothetical protein
MAGQEVLATIIEKRSELIELGMVRQIVGAAIKDPSDGVKQEGRRIIKGLTAKQPEIAGTILDIATETLADADRLFRRGSRLVIRAVAQQLPQMAGRAEELIESSRPPKVPNLARSTKALLALSVDQ